MRFFYGNSIPVLSVMYKSILNAQKIHFDAKYFGCSKQDFYTIFTIKTCTIQLCQLKKISTLKRELLEIPSSPLPPPPI